MRTCLVQVAQKKDCRIRGLPIEYTREWILGAGRENIIQAYSILFHFISITSFHLCYCSCDQRRPFSTSLYPGTVLTWRYNR